MSNILRITFEGTSNPVLNNQQLVFDYHYNYPTASQASVQIVFKTTPNPAIPYECEIGSTGIDKATKYEAALTAHVAANFPGDFTIVRTNEVVEVTCTNGGDIFNQRLSPSNATFATLYVAPNIEILDAPNTDIVAAYRPIIFRCKARISGYTPANYLPPLVFCDIYIDDVYYKTLSKSQFIDDDGSKGTYEFDIQDAIQEVMGYNLPEIGESLIYNMTETLKKVMVKYRAAKYDRNGFMYSEQLEPVQGTSSSAPISGGGVDSTEHYALNATIQHEERQNFQVFLNSWKTGAWNNVSYPLTKRPKVFKMCKTDSSYFPIITDSNVDSICLNYKPKGGVYTTVCKSLGTTCPPIPGLTVTPVDDPGYNQIFQIAFDPIPAGQLLTVYLFDSTGTLISTDDLIYGTGVETSYDYPQPHGIFTLKFTLGCNLSPNPADIFTNIGIPVQTVTMPATNELTFSKNELEVADPDAGYIVLTEAILFEGYTNSNGYAAGNILITSLPSNGVLIYYGTPVFLPNFPCTLSGIQGGGLLFWPTGDDNSLPFADFSTSFNYTVYDEYAVVNDSTTLNINFIAAANPEYTMQVAPGDAIDPVGGDTYSCCSIGNGWTRGLKMDTLAPEIGTQLINPDNDLPAIAANLGTSSWTGDSYSTTGIKWIRFVGSFPGDIWDVDPATGILLGISTTYSC